MKNFNIKNILVPIDFSDSSIKALEHAVYMAKLCNASISLIHNTEPLMANVSLGGFYDMSTYNFVDEEKMIYEKAKKHLQKIAEEIEKKNEIKTTPINTLGWVREQILETAEKIKADIIVMGTHGIKGFREFVVGSNTFRVVSEAKCPVLSVQQNSKTNGFKNIVLPFRDKAHSREKVDYAMAIAKIYGSTIHVMGIDTEDRKSHFEKIELEAEQIKRIVEKSGLKCDIKMEVSAYLSEEALKYANEINADLIIIMSDLDKMNISEYFMGPFSQQIVNHSTIPVLSIRPTKFNPNTIELHGYGW